MPICTAIAQPTAPSEMPTFVIAWVAERNTAASSPPTRRSSAPSAAWFAFIASMSTVATTTKAAKSRMNRYPSADRNCTRKVARTTVRGPCRSARAPTGTPATSPIRPEIVRPNPTWRLPRCTTRVKYSTNEVTTRPNPNVFTSVASPYTRWGPGSGSSEKRMPLRRGERAEIIAVVVRYRVMAWVAWPGRRSNTSATVTTGACPDVDGGPAGDGGD